MQIRHGIAGLALAAAICAGTAGTAMAGPVGSTVSVLPGTPFNTVAMTGSATDGTLMGGSVVTVLFAGGGSESAVWSGLTSSAVGTGWSLSQPGDTFNTPWVLANTSADTIIEFAFDGLLGNTSFDVISDPTLSPGSARGNDFGDAIASDDTAAGILSAEATYSNELSVGGVFYGDEYLRLDVAFEGTGLTRANTFSFEADTDNADAQRGGITPTPTPEPASVALLGVALAGLGALRRRRG